PCAPGHPCEIYNWNGSAPVFRLAFLADDLLIVPPEYKFKGRDVRVVRLSPRLPVSQVQPISAAIPKIPFAPPLPAEAPKLRVPGFSRATSSGSGSLSRPGPTAQARMKGVGDAG